MGLLGQRRTDHEPRRKRRTYTELEVERALAAVAAVDGHVRRASRVLADKGLDVPPQTLSCWKNDSHRDLYLRVRLEFLPHLKRARWQTYNDLAHGIAPT